MGEHKASKEGGLISLKNLRLVACIIVRLSVYAFLVAFVRIAFGLQTGKWGGKSF